MEKCAYYHSPIGIIRIKERDGFLEAVTFVDDSVEGLSTSSPILAITSKWLDRYFSGEALNKLPRYRLVGTEFQKRVWEALLSIPYGSTASYMDIAKMIDPNAPGMMCRAVGNAVGANPLAILIPCHRVIRSDGKIGQYRWGAERKEWLLKHEAVTQISKR